MTYIIFEEMTGFSHQELALQSKATFLNIKILLIMAIL